MKLMSRIILLLCITVFLIGCKLAVIVVEGGEVQSTASGTCVAGMICIVDVNDSNFSETFTAVPDTGWYFQKWNLGDRFFCGGTTYPTCTLSFQGYKESQDVENMVASSDMFYLMPVFKPIPSTVMANGAVVIDGKAWLQPKDFVNYSYNQISEICPDTLCSGTLPGSKIDLTGYIWASTDDVELLFGFYTDEGKWPLDDFAYTLAEGEDAGCVINHTLYGMVSDSPGYTHGIFVATVYEGLPPCNSSQRKLSIYGPVPVSASKGESDLGAWFWRRL